jgi:hypothetical protein
MLPQKYSEAFESFKEASMHMQRKLEDLDHFNNTNSRAREVRNLLKQYQQENHSLKVEKQALKD